ncbi:tRNA-uridine 2-sulfurtransferase [Candidatus Hakubella thermalkaliphila]|uniref:tRNA-specific 2-thiouridylase MnmA n=2 Tax=Candidatus Hakubella thermalkaliphila TaxID=2754717 RepID=A0A6V8PEX8_9ACTN|nr:tRNA 2-thiouridine(34) synthase MnmA [Candidatus Hakubella thermalkaliphila]GFP18839.1 tRNA-uridine 2-sulfurtransferase [Candidatus Hakubella thermalkaliphila]GFP29381.1 tRNA-uridine 2-sulfurtransferase [Candidatus Hakubella thermalkaliphila]GFP41406.1 tRNA-uridine 2-sulfurtransferase [Candidatus Hakubella thermalkaliphila]
MLNELMRAHLIDPQNIGTMESPDAVGQAGSVECGTLVTAQMKVRDGLIQDLKFLVYGPGQAIAACSFLSQYLQGKPLDQAARMTGRRVASLMGEIEKEMGCFKIVAAALGHCLENFISGPMGKLKPLEKLRDVSRERVAVAMSGGVDSSTAALILKEEGYDVIGLTMRLWEDGESDEGRMLNLKATDLDIEEDNYPEDRPRSCCSPLDIQDAKEVADKIGIPHYVINLADLFEQRVIRPFCDQYLEGMTPNPCLNCNRFIKLDILRRRAHWLGAYYLSTGHYVRVRSAEENGRFLVYRAEDSSKDQSCMFWSATQEQLCHFLSPLGDYTKERVRKLAERAYLPVADKMESQEICFISDNNYHRFLREKVGYCPRPGPIVDTEGKVIGTHQGLAFYTIGQRRGLGIGGPGPYYVVGIDTEKNLLIVGHWKDVYRRELIAEEVNFIPFDHLEGDLRVTVQVRYRGEEGEAIVRPVDESRVQVTFRRPIRAITPGQSVVFYQGDLLVGGGIISSFSGSGQAVV